MAQIGDFAENALLDAIFNTTSYAPAAIYMSLHTADPGDTGASEVTGGSYARQNVTTSFAAASGGSVSSNALIEWTNMPATTVTHIGVWDASTSGNFLWGGTLTASKTTNSGDTFQITSGNATFTLS